MKQYYIVGLWEQLYGDDLALTAETLGEVALMFGERRQAMERRGLKVNLEKTKMVVTGMKMEDGCRWGGIRVECEAAVLELILFYVERVGSGVTEGVRV